AALAGGLAVAGQRNEDRLEGLNKALILTGGYANAPAEDLAALARELGSLQGVTSGSATKALQAAAETGKRTGDRLGLAARAAEQWRVATGAAIEETIALFVELGKDPLDKLLDLNEAEHFLTES